jgi:hypothetical protein
MLVCSILEKVNSIVYPLVRTSDPGVKILRERPKRDRAGNIYTANRWWLSR